MFQNPLRQNFGHTRALAEFLALDDSLFQSIIFFTGNCEFKTPMPKQVLTSGLARYIQAFHEERLDSNQVATIVEKLHALKRDGAPGCRDIERERGFDAEKVSLTLGQSMSDPL
jgi:hypothetical protein